MDILQKIVSGFGYDISSLSGIEYHDPIVGAEPTQCDGKECYGGCTPACYSCRDGNK